MMTIVLAYNYVATPIFRATTKVIFQESDNKHELDPVTLLSRQNFIENQIQELRTEAFTKDVFNSLSAEARAKLRKRLTEEAGNESTKHGRISTIVYVAKNFAKHLIFSPKLRGPGTDHLLLVRIQDNLSIKPTRKTEVVTVAYDDEDPDLALVVAKSAAEIIINRNLAIRRELSGSLKKFFDEQFKIVKQRLRDAENALEKFKRSKAIASLENESKAIIERHTQAEILYNKVVSDRRELEGRLDAIEANLAAGQKNLASSVTRTTSPYVLKLKDRLVELEVILTNLWAQGLPEQNPKIVDLQSEIDEIKHKLISEATKYVNDENIDGITDPFAQISKYKEESNMLGVELHAIMAKQNNLRALLDSYSRKLSKIPEVEVVLYRLTRDREVNHKLYVTLLEEREKARIKEASELGNIRIIEPAKLFDSPVRPRKLLNVLIAFFSSLLVAGTLILFLDVLSEKVITERQVAEAVQIPVVVCIPKLNQADIINKTSSNGSVANTAFAPLLQNEFNQLYSALDLDQRQSSIILVTSSIPGEGKSTVSRLLAIASAQLGRKTLLIDGDLRQPTLHTILGLSRTPGLTNLAGEFKISEASLSDLNVSILPANKGGVYENHIESKNWRDGEDKVPEAIRATNEENLIVLTSGFCPRSPVKFWASPICHEVFAYLRLLAQVVILDSPPTIGVPDAANMARHADHILFCIESGQLRKATLQHSLRLVSGQDGAKKEATKIVLNKIQTYLTGDHDYYKHYHNTYQRYMTVNSDKSDLDFAAREG